MGANWKCSLSSIKEYGRYIFLSYYKGVLTIAGTHYIRAWNNKLQKWGKTKTRQELSLEPANPTEEGLASIHSILFRKDPCLWRGALLYYTIYKVTHIYVILCFG